MAGRKRKSSPDAGTRRVSSRNKKPASSSSHGSGPSNGDGLPDVYRHMIKDAEKEAARRDQGSSGPPTKRRRPGEKAAPIEPPQRTHHVVPPGSHPDTRRDGSEENIEHVFSTPAPNLQTMELDSDDDGDDDDEDEDIEFEDVDIGVSSASKGPRLKDLELNLTAAKADATARRAMHRRKTFTKAEKERRVEIHKMHLLCLLSHVQRRNHWCNDEDVQAALRPLLTDKMVKFLKPSVKLNQYSQSEALKNGVSETRIMFQSQYEIVERGLRRALWAEDKEQLKDYQLPDDMETIVDKKDFLAAAKSCQGSRDVGAQLFCALLRGVGVETRLVCSLQPLSCIAGCPTMVTKRRPATPSKAATLAEKQRAAMAIYDRAEPASTVSSSRRRLGHPNAAAYEIPSVDPPPLSRREAPPRKRIRGESPYPVYWVEVLDVAYQKWRPVDPIVTRSHWKPRTLEPPASDRENCMTYVVAFEADGSAKDITQRYAKAFSSKTIKMRVDGLLETRDGNINSSISAGQRWWRKVMRTYKKLDWSDVDEIEDTELKAEAAKEPMPSSIADFKDHPVYALQRHLRRNEVLLPNAQVSGTVGAGSKGPLEQVYRRRDVRMARSRDKWYRLGRIVRPDEEAVKILPPKRIKKRSRFDDDDDEDDPDKVGLWGDGPGTPIFMFSQTDAYDPPPVVDGRVPKNKFGNIDVYVPSMVPRGGVHVVHAHAARAAFVLGVDYAPALTGFQFKGRHGTAVLSGAVVPAHAEEGVRAVIEALEDLEQQQQEERRTLRALSMWSRFLKGLRIRERVGANIDASEVEEQEQDGSAAVDKGKGNACHVTETIDNDYEAGGFMIE